ncbi:hypothetical protein FACS189465_1320 [Clostridia bacterium]|nr:hypothetical protein FACS189465_1320 [Clostridia bacterium]
MELPNKSLVDSGSLSLKYFERKRCTSAFAMRYSGDKLMRYSGDKLMRYSGDKLIELELDDEELDELLELELELGNGKRGGIQH